MGKDPMGKDPMGKDPMGKDPMGKDPMGKDPMGKDPMGQGQGQPMGQGQGQPMGQGQGQPMGQGQGQPTGKGQPGGGGAPGQGGRPGDVPPGAGAPEVNGKATDPNQAHLRKAGDLQLEDLRRMVNKETLQKYNITQEEWDAHLKAEAEARAKLPKNDAAKADAKGGDRTGSTRVNAGVRKAETGPGKSGDLSRGAGAKAPPEYSAASEKFSEFLAQPPKQGKK
jgi:hypothetical protein